MQLLLLYSMAKYFHHKSVHISSTGGLSFAPAGQLKSLANSTWLLRGTLTRHGEGLCPLRLCGMGWIFEISYDLTTADSSSSWYVGLSSMVHQSIANVSWNCVLKIFAQKYIFYPKKLVGGEWEVWKTSRLLLPPEMLQGVVGEPQPNVVGNILRRTSASFPVVDAIVASRIGRELLSFMWDVELAVLVDLKIRTREKKKPKLT